MDIFNIKKERTYISSRIPVTGMTLKYVIREIDVNKKWSRGQEISWEKRKRFIYDLFLNLKVKNKFSFDDKTDVNYNIHAQTPTYSLSCYDNPSNPITIISIFRLDAEENAIVSGEITDENFLQFPLFFRFSMSKIEHKDLSIFSAGQEEKVFDYLTRQDHSGRFCKTFFGIFISERLNKIYLIKQSDEGTMGFEDFIEYLKAKSTTFKDHIDSENTFRLNPVQIEDSFNVEKVETVRKLDMGINGDLIAAYRERSGENDPFSNAVIVPLTRLLGIGRNLKLSLEFSEDGDPEAKRIFDEVYGSFSNIQGEDIERIFTKFKVYYEKLGGVVADEDFKRNKSYTYSAPTDIPNQNDVLNAFIWFSNQLG